MDVAVAMPLILIAAGMLVMTLVASGKHVNTYRSNATVGLAVQSVFEEMRAAEFASVFSLYNAEPFDDPGGPGTAPGHLFDIEGFDPWPGAAETAVGEILLPAINTGDAVDTQWEVREDLVDAALGMPRDLNGDSIADGADHSADYALLPIAARVRWTGPNGRRELTMHTVLVRWKL